MDPLRRGVAEALGRTFQLTAIVGSGIMAERLSGGNASMALLANVLATWAVLLCLIIRGANRRCGSPSPSQLAS